MDTERVVSQHCITGFNPLWMRVFSESQEHTKVQHDASSLELDFRSTTPVFGQRI